MNFKQYTLIGLIPSFLSCAGPVNLLRDNKIPYTVTCNYPEQSEMPLNIAYGIDLTVRQICLENGSGETVRLTFRQGRVSGNARKLTEELSDKLEGEKVLLSPGDILDAKDNIADGCIVAIAGRRKNVENY